MQFDKHNVLCKMLLTTPGHVKGKFIYSEHVPPENKFYIHIVTHLKPKNPFFFPCQAYYDKHPLIYGMKS